jgi:imidazoleglycerol-phosphate dehydratase
MPRQATISRLTSETDVSLSLDLDVPSSNVSTGVGFFDHMLDLLARHSLVGLTINAKGDLHIDPHHTVEDVGLAFGEALVKALGDKSGIVRYGHFSLPMDETLANVALDLSGRPAFVFNVKFTGPLIGQFPVELVEEFFKSVAHAGKMNLHVNVAYGTNNHHIAEAIFKAFARSLRMAVAIDPRQPGVPSSKGTLTV